MRGQAGGGGRMAVYYTYILRCGDGSLYTGITTDPLRRLNMHRAGTGARYTRARGAVGLAALWQSADRAAASRLEYRLKTLSRAQKLALIAGGPLPDAFDPAAYRRLPLPEEEEEAPPAGPERPFSRRTSD
ncbi:MAG: GIY-YIG nuclease family protein [Oscillospiraceae bacterium]|nr:GIY-YIG nuclease family protein [Oscillospiraceae bacterium]